MEYVCTQARFRFWDGKIVYTVEYAYGIHTWYIFKDDETRDAVFSKKQDPKKSKTPTRGLAEEILMEYLDN